MSVGKQNASAVAGRLSERSSATILPAVRWFARPGMILAGAMLLTLSYEPFGLAPLAWFALVPLLLVLRGVRSPKAAFAWGWLAGLMFFGVNIWWLWTATIPGTITLILYFSLYWALAAIVIRGLGLLEGAGLSWGRDSFATVAPGHPERSEASRRVDAWRSFASGYAVAKLRLRRGESLRMTGTRVLLSILLIATVWVAIEWLRGYVIWGFHWMPVGVSQSSIPVMCQIADTLGVFGVSFWVVLVNAVVFFMVVKRREMRSLMPALAGSAAVVLAVLIYGLYRVSEDATVPGPRVMVVQCNQPHLPGGARTVSREDSVVFHVTRTMEALQAEDVDLVVWSETAVPPLNREALEELQGSRGGQVMAQTHRLIGDLSRTTQTALVVGANHVGGWIHQDNARVGTEIHNSVFYYGRDGRQSDQRYDKIHLVPFAERVPFQGSVRFLYQVMMWLAPPVASQPLVAGNRDELTVFAIQPEAVDHRRDLGVTTDHKDASEAVSRFVTPICLESVDPEAVADMVRPPDGEGKQVDFLVNVSNDGWFAPIERHQHLQNVAFRCIENRLPQARASNTGISGFIDSAGRVVQAIPPGTAGTSVHRLMLDKRVTFFTRYGNLFAVACVLISAGLVVSRPVAWLINRTAGAAW